MGHASSAAASAAPEPFLSQLPDALIQLVCHSLSAMEILSLARASKQMMHAIDTPFAWLHSPLSIRMGRLRSPQLAPTRSAPLARAPVSLLWTGQHAFADPNALSDEQVLDSTFLSGGAPHILTLDLSAARNPTQWIPMLRHPSCAALRVLRIYSLEKSGEVPTAALEALQALAHLHTLSLYPDQSSLHADWGLLAHLSRLTSLEISNVIGFGNQTLLAAIVRCSTLRELRLARFAQPAVELFETVALLPQLRLLWFGQHCHNVESVLDLPSRFQTACARLQLLEDLQFSWLPMLRQALPYLVECKSLRFVSLRRHVHTVAQEAAALYCSPQLAAVLVTLPQCQFSLRVLVHPSVTASQIQHFRSTFERLCAVERTNQAKGGLPLSPTSVTVRLSVGIESARKGE